MYDPQKHNRKSLRLKNYDYSKPGHYYVTICTANRFHLFGSVNQCKMILNDYGEVARDEWTKTPNIRPYVRLDVFVVMPNHLHGIVILTSKGRDVSRYVPTFREFRSPSNNLGAIIRGYKGAVTTQINKMDNQRGRKIWQRNYYERVIRDDRELNNIRKYIQANPQNWGNDKLNIS